MSNSNFKNLPVGIDEVNACNKEHFVEMFLTENYREQHENLSPIATIIESILYDDEKLAVATVKENVKFFYFMHENNHEFPIFYIKNILVNTTAGDEYSLLITSRERNFVLYLLDEEHDVFKLKSVNNYIFGGGANFSSVDELSIKKLIKGIKDFLYSFMENSIELLADNDFALSYPEIAYLDKDKLCLNKELEDALPGRLKSLNKYPIESQRYSLGGIKPHGFNLNHKKLFTNLLLVCLLDRIYFEKHKQHIFKISESNRISPYIYFADMQINNNRPLSAIYLDIVNGHNYKFNFLFGGEEHHAVINGKWLFFILNAKSVDFDEVMSYERIKNIYSKDECGPLLRLCEIYTTEFLNSVKNYTWILDTRGDPLNLLKLITRRKFKLLTLRFTRDLPERLDSSDFK